MAHSCPGYGVYVPQRLAPRSQVRDQGFPEDKTLRRARTTLRYTYGVSKGIGRTQQEILDLIEGYRLNRDLPGGRRTRPDPFLTCTRLARLLHRSPRQIRRALHSLQGRGLVTLSREVVRDSPMGAETGGPSLLAWLPGEYEAEQARREEWYAAYCARPEVIERKAEEQRAAGPAQRGPGTDGASPPLDTGEVAGPGRLRRCPWARR